MPRAKFFVYCNRGSTSARLLADALDGVRIKRVGSKYRQKPDDVVINWGCTDVPANIDVSIQPPQEVQRASSKMRTFDLLGAADIPHPEYTTNRELAQEWNSQVKVLGRDLDTGSQGRGITVYPKGSVVGFHKFYVEYMRKQREFRYHVVNGWVVHVAEKMKRKGAENPNKYIRSHGRGWVLAFNHLDDNPPPDGGKKLACFACSALGLDFGAVDMGWNEKDGFFVIEVNSAPGIEETTLEAYANAFKARGEW